MRFVATDGPTGLALCDRVVTTVCRCARTEPSLRHPCKTLRADARRWKVRVQARDGQQIRAIQQRCEKILKGVASAYGCQ